MNSLVIGNILMFIASVLMVCVGIVKNNKKAITLQTGQMILMTIGDIFLGSIPGAISSILAIVRNVFCYKQQLTKSKKILLIVVLSVCSLLFNNIGWLVLIPIFATSLFTWFVTTDSVIGMKVLIIVNSVCWLIHDAYIQAYTVLPFDIITIASTIISLRIILKQNLNNQ